MQSTRALPALIAAAIATVALAGVAFAASPEPAASASPAPGSGSAAAGAKLFQANCASCHGAHGEGVPGAFPPLAKNAFVTGDAVAVIKAVANGLDGVPVTVNGATYKGVMPAWKGTLSHKQIADVVTYIRGAWKNDAGPVTEADVTAATK